MMLKQDTLSQNVSHEGGITSGSEKIIRMTYTCTVMVHKVCVMIRIQRSTNVLE